MERLIRILQIIVIAEELQIGNHQISLNYFKVQNQMMEPIVVENLPFLRRSFRPLHPFLRHSFLPFLPLPPFDLYLPFSSFHPFNSFLPFDCFNPFRN
jgi:hypothetical protein